MNVEKVGANLAHAVIIGCLSYIAAHPDAGLQWLIPALAWCGQCLQPPNLTPGVPTDPLVVPPPPEVPHVPPA